MNVRCTLCLATNPYTKAHSDVRLVTINGRDVLICRDCSTRRKGAVEKSYEPKDR
jgi:hypothetical protein